MEQTTKRTLASILIGVYLLAACAPAPAVTQNPALVQQVIEQSVALTIAAEHAQSTEQQALIAAQTPTLLAEAETAVLAEEPAAPTTTAETVPLPGGSDSTTQETGAVEPPVGTDTPTPIPASCTTREVDPFLPTQLKLGDMATVKNPVNLRTQPSRLNRIILTLKPDTQVEIIGGPAHQEFAEGGEYFWWKVKLPGGLTGWSAEISACREFYFMEPVR